jgi:hypothetical protein
MKSILSFTFDNAKKSVFSKAYPIMRRYDIKGTVYVTTSKIGQSGYMTRNELIQLSKDGWEIGSNSCSHVVLSKCSTNCLNYEFRRSKELLEKLLLDSGTHSDVAGFAFPYGGNDTVSLREMKEVEKYYEYSRLSSNRPSRITPHKREINVMVEPLTNLLFGRNPSFGGITDFILNIEAAIVSKGWFIFYTQDISDFSVPSLREFKLMAKYAHELRENGALNLKTPADVIKNSQISRVDFSLGAPEVLVCDRNFQRWSQASHHRRVSQVKRFVLKPWHLLIHINTKRPTPVADFGSWSAKNATFAMIQDELINILATVRQPTSILLLGSAAVIQQPNDYDILIITNFFHPSVKPICSKLTSAFPTIDFSIGRYYRGRLKREVSIFLYEAKSVGVILSGADIRKDIVIAEEELFPHEAVRLLLNRTFDTVLYMVKSTQDPALIDVALRKVKKVHIDVTLLMGGFFNPDSEMRKKMYVATNSSPILRNIEDARQLIKSDLDTVLRKANIDSFEAWLFLCKMYFKYPLLNRIKNALTAGPSFLLRCPSYDFFRLCNQFLLLDIDRVPIFLDTNFQDMLKLYKLGSQPVIPKARM